MAFNSIVSIVSIVSMTGGTAGSGDDNINDYSGLGLGSSDSNIFFLDESIVSGSCCSSIGIIFVDRFTLL